jgi:hypothetical protein
LIATSPSVPNQAFRYGENAYGLQFHLEVTEAMIRQWMNEYEEEFQYPHSPPFSKDEILIQTESNLGTYSKNGMDFVKKFFAQPDRL